MGQPNPQATVEGSAPDPGGVMLSPASEAAGNRPAADGELATMRQLMETLFSRVETLQQNQARQFSGVHDRLDAVELELPLIQEQSALRIRDLETRMGAEIEAAARTAVEEATAELHAQVTVKFGSLAAHIESQNQELASMRESKKAAESKLDRVVQDIERLCGNLSGEQPVGVYRPAGEFEVSPFRTKIASHVRRPAVEAVPGWSQPAVSEPAIRRIAAAPSETTGHGMAASGLPVWQQPVPSQSAASPRTAVPGFDEWKRQFMQEGEPLNPTFGADAENRPKLVVCPRCYSCRTRPATRTRFDHVLRLTGYIPHRCRSCAHRFYKRGAWVKGAPADDNPEDRREEALET